MQEDSKGLFAQIYERVKSEGGTDEEAEYIAESVVLGTLIAQGKKPNRWEADETVQPRHRGS